MKAPYKSVFLRFVLLILVLLVLAATLAAQGTPVGKSRDLTLSSPARIGDVVLPAGDYRVTHLMDGDRHIMVFKSVKGEKKEVRVPCKMQTLDARARHTEQRYEHTPAGDRQLMSMVFAGEKVEHVF